MTTPPFRVKALYEYASKEEDDLNFPNEQVITVTDIEDADWFFGEYVDTAGDKQEGLFPKNFVTTFEPETPPRPSRTSKAKKEVEPLQRTDEAGKGLGIGESELSPPSGGSVPSHSEQVEGSEQPAVEARQPAAQKFRPEPPSVAPREPTAPKPTPPTASKPAPPPTAEKPVSGSFRDRINAFNKSAAPPLAPTKPSALGSSSGSGFVKKPFVAPPPSKNAYVPPPREPAPQRVYRREEDPELLGQDSNDAGKEDQSIQPQADPLETAEEDQPKPTSLKERIALLQKQQMEQAARHAEVKQKKEKPKPPLKPRMEANEHTGSQEEDLGVEDPRRINSGDDTGKRSVEISRAPPPDLTSSSMEPHKPPEATPLNTPVTVPLRDVVSNENVAENSADEDTENGGEYLTSRDDSSEKPGRKTSPNHRRPIPQEADVGDEEDNSEADEAEPEDEEDEEEMDSKLKKRMEIRERMAKMSGGMGMAGMFGPPGGLPSRSSAKQSSASSERKVSGNATSALAENPASHAPPVPVMHGLQKVRSPEQSELRPEVTKEQEDVPRSIVQRRDPEDMPDVEDLQEDPISQTQPRRSTERTEPPSALQGS